MVQQLEFRKVFGGVRQLSFSELQGKDLPDESRLIIEEAGREIRARQAQQRLDNIQKHRPLSELSVEELAQRREKRLANRAARKERRKLVSKARRHRKTKNKGWKSYAEFNAFYDSKEWRQLRYKVFTKFGKVCACCESITGPFHIDHIKPRFKHPELELEISNLQVLCEACNIGKGGWDETDWRNSNGDLSHEQAAHMREILQ